MSKEETIINELQKKLRLVNKQLVISEKDDTLENYTIYLGGYPWMKLYFSDAKNTWVLFFREFDCNQYGLSDVIIPSLAAVSKSMEQLNKLIEV